jgi:hypothetical protein
MAKRSSKRTSNLVKKKTVKAEDAPSPEKPKTITEAQFGYIKDKLSSVPKEQLAKDTGLSVEEIEIIIRAITCQDAEVVAQSYGRRGVATVGTEAASQLSDESRKRVTPYSIEENIHRIRK